MHACMHALVGVGVVVLLCAHERTFHASRQSGRIVVVQWKSLTKPPCDSVSFSYFSLLPCSSPCTVSVPAPPFSPSPMFSAKHFAPYHPRAHETSSHSLLLQGFGEDLGLDTRRLVRCVHLNHKHTRPFTSADAQSTRLYRIRARVINSYHSAHYSPNSSSHGSISR